MITKLDSPRAGDNLLKTLTAHFFAERDRLIERANNLKVDPSSGLELQDLPAGPLLRIGRRFVEVSPARAPAGGIPARVGSTPGSAVCTLYTWDGTAFALGTQADTIRNHYTAAVGANKDITVYRWAGALWVLTEQC